MINPIRVLKASQVLLLGLCRGLQVISCDCFEANLSLHVDNLWHLDTTYVPETRGGLLMSVKYRKQGILIQHMLDTIHSLAVSSLMSQKATLQSARGLVSGGFLCLKAILAFTLRVIQ